ncbi:alpha-1,3-mannosyl-glycoprotein 4-beta-N-acetylglucosaminyltransferase A [Drosophila mojavensis]|nr:alpha-1,3-mannosyl-glycoprotein 4-beta-N-acetylglucosaminyltransferase A [Drosophila mojavensis]
MVMLAVYQLYQEVQYSKLENNKFSHVTTTPDEEETSLFTVVFQFPPHLLYGAKPLSPAYLSSQGRTDVSIVLGVPTLDEGTDSHLRATLYNLIENMSAEDQRDTLIVVYIGEEDETIIEPIVQQIEENFAEHLKSGLIDIVVPEESYYYPFLQEDLSKLSKQNVDLAYLMAYAHAKGQFYVQLTDAVLPKPNFVRHMRKFALVRLALNNPFQPTWFLLDFFPNEVAGKLFKGEELPYLITYLHVFYKDILWTSLIENFITSTLCHKGAEECLLQMTTYWQTYDIPLFQRFGNVTLSEKLRLLSSKT